MHSYKVTVHFVGGTFVDVFQKNTTASKYQIIEWFAGNRWVNSDDDDMVINTANITYVEVTEI